MVVVAVAAEGSGTTGVCAGVFKEDGRVREADGAEAVGGAVGAYFEACNVDFCLRDADTVVAEGDGTTRVCAWVVEVDGWMREADGAGAVGGAAGAYLEDCNVDGCSRDADTVVDKCRGITGVCAGVAKADGWMRDADGAGDVGDDAGVCFEACKEGSR